MYDEDLINLDEWLRRLKIEYHIFFSGNRRKPPDDLRMRVEKLVKKLSECSDMSPSQRFRFTTLVTRFYVYRDLWRRTLQEREMGTESKAKAPTGDDVSARPPGRPEEAVCVSISDPKAEEEKVRQLYDAVLRMRKTDSQEPLISYQRFAKYVETQTLDIQKKHGCATVIFTIALEEDAIRFRAAAETC